MKGLLAIAVLCALAVPAWAASDRRNAPAGSFEGAPPEFTRFTEAELMRGFLALAFGADLRVGARPKGVRRFTRPAEVFVMAGGSVARGDQIQRIVEEYNAKVPALRLKMTSDRDAADVEVHLIDKKDFSSALENAFGRRTARAFVAKTNPQCMTSVKSQVDGEIVRAVSFVIVDQGDDVFFDCAYHELLHAFGLSNHDQRNPWTMLNQNRLVGYLSVYDRALLTMLYHPRVRPGMTAVQVRAVLPQVIRALNLTAPADRAE
jgi:hypothetical protein